jgi:hypothetical protein
MNCARSDAGKHSPMSEKSDERISFFGLSMNAAFFDH